MIIIMEGICNWIKEYPIGSDSKSDWIFSLKEKCKGFIWYREVLLQEEQRQTIYLAIGTGMLLSP